MPLSWHFCSGCFFWHRLQYVPKVFREDVQSSTTQNEYLSHSAFVSFSRIHFTSITTVSKYFSDLLCFVLDGLNDMGDVPLPSRDTQRANACRKNYAVCPFGVENYDASDESRETQSELIVGPPRVGCGRLTTRPTTVQKRCHSKSVRRTTRPVCPFLHGEL